MESSLLLAQVRRMVRQELANLGGGEESPQETLLIRGGHYCGRRFAAASGPTAIWFIEEDELKLYSGEGRLLTTLRASGAEKPLRRAA